MPSKFAIACYLAAPTVVKADWYEDFYEWFWEEPYVPGDGEDYDK